MAARAVALAAAFLAVACYSPSFKEGRPCSAQGECPSGQSCNAADNKCYSDGVGPSDAAANLPDADPNTPDADPNAPDADPSAPDATSRPDAASIPDAGPGTPDASTSCDPLNQSSCPSGQKCTNVIEAGGTSTVRCVGEGTVSIGGACTVTDNGIPDDCVRGSYCNQGICRDICGTSPNTCPANELCVQYSGVFVGFSGVGVCDPSCDPFDDTVNMCVAPEYCYFNPNPSVQAGICAQTAGGTPGGVPEGGDCMFINDCEPGHGCLLPESESNPTQTTCAKYCDANQGAIQCGGGGGNWRCARLNLNFNAFPSVPSYYGICLHCGQHPQLPACGGSQPY